MGVILDEVCCIRSMDFSEYENYHSTKSRTKEKESDKSLETYNDIYYNSSLLKTLPETEINNRTLKNNSRKEFKSLKALPINTEKIIRKQSGNPLDYYDVLKKLGKGTFGTVYKVMHKTTGTIRAMKVIPKNSMRRGFTDEDIIREINILKTLEHPHIIKLFEFYTYKDNYYLINEFCTEGDLSDKLSKLRKLPEFAVKILMIQIFNAVKYLNEKNVIHGDLKLENIMIDSYLDNGELIPQNKNINFIASLKEDEKEINEFIRQNELKRANTFNILTKKRFQIKHNEESSSVHNNIKKENENIDSVSKLLQIRIKRGKTILGPEQSKKQNNNIVKINNKNISFINDRKANNNKKSAFSYLNGQEDDEEEEQEDNSYNKENTSQNNINNKIRPNGIEINNYQINNNNLLKNQKK